jgi:peptidoglycan/LPS O-acetylase OafA/YrhL
MNHVAVRRTRVGDFVSFSISSTIDGLSPTRNSKIFAGERPMEGLTIAQPGGTYAFPTVTGRRFVTLDAMRGIAAISVMMFHYLLGTPYHIFDHAYYAVDFFFVLSGVVLTHAYVTKIQRGMAFPEFMKARIIRLYPLYVIGLILGATLLPSYIVLSSIAGFRRTDYLLSIVFNALFIPYPNHGAVPFIMNGTMDGAIFPFNIPAWSLFFEMLASVALFVAIRRRVRPEYIVGGSFILLIATFLHYRTFNVGWGTETIFAGVPRTAFAFFFGVVMYKTFTSMRGMRIVLHPSMILGLTAVMFILPISQLSSRIVSGTTLCIALIPILIFLGLSVDNRAENHAFFVWLGRISYGVYAVHFPVYRIVVFILAATSLTSEIEKAPLLLACLLAAVVIVVAHLLTVFFDEPVRRWFNSVSAVGPA